MARKNLILIIDDNMDTVELLRKRFRVDGFETEEAYDGEEGLRKVTEVNPDLIVLDVMMPKIDGFTVCNQLKEDERTKNIPILLLTAKSEVGDKVQGLDRGADGYITKPFDYKEVAARVRSLLAKKDAAVQLAEKEKFEALDYLVDEVSHEVRNPLVAIGGFARRVRENLPEGSKNRKYMDIILQNVISLEKMVDHLIGLKSATISFPDSVNINDLVQEALFEFTEPIQDRNIQVTLQLMENPPEILADKVNFTTAIANMIENAIEAMKDEPRHLQISTQVNEGFFEVEIRDSGRGISREKIKNIYDPFLSSKIYGPGLGLTFALKTIQSHKGMVEVESQEGQGTLFTIRLPIRSAHINGN